MQQNQRQKHQDLSSLSCMELRERLTRQEKILSNRQFMAKLPDKGQKILIHVQQLCEALATQELVESAAEQLSAMSVTEGTNNARHASVVRPGLSTLPEFEREDGVDKSSTSQCSDTMDFRTDTTPALSAPSTSGKKKQAGFSIEAVRQRAKQSEPKKTVLLSVAESARLIVRQEERLQELQMLQASQLLQDQSGRHVVGTVTAEVRSRFGRYRNHDDHVNHDRASDSETSDEDGDLD